MHTPTIAGIRINGGRLCLDFVNTATWADSAPDLEFLGSYEDLLTWGGRQNLITPKEAAQQRDGAADIERDRTLAQARTLRGAFRDLFEPGRPAVCVAAAAHAVNTMVAALGARLRLDPHGDGLRLSSGDGLAGAILAPLVVSALDLAASPARETIRVCPGDGCHWLFLDLSRNGTRRWCSMESCGNKAKARAHYLSHRAGPRP